VRRLCSRFADLLLTRALTHPVNSVDYLDLQLARRSIRTREE
jgi:hypothetical protein